MKKFGKLFGVAGALLTGLICAPAYAAVTLPTDLGEAQVEAYAAIILAALAVLWIVRKLIKTTNRS